MLRAGGALFMLVLAAALSHFAWLQPAELRLVDVQFRWLRAIGPRPVANDVVVVGFNEDTANVLREPLTLWHSHLGRFLQAIAISGAAAVGLDVVLPDRSYDSIVPGNDRKLLTGILLARRSVPVVLALTIDPSGKTRPVYPAFAAAAGVDAVGYALLPIDPDGVVRRFDEHLEWDGGAVATLAGQMARRMGKSVHSGLIDFAAGPAFDFIPLQTVLAWYDAGDSAQLRRTFAGKAVLLGSVLKYEDRLVAPVNLVAWDEHAPNAPGVLLHAQALRSLLNDGLVQPVAPMIPFLLTMAAALLWWWTLRPAAALLLLLLLGSALVGASTLALAWGVALPVASAMLVALLAVAGRQALETSGSLRERLRLRRAFSGYVSPAVLQEILAGTLNPMPGGVKRFACVLFADIRGYTSISELLSPEQTITFLNRYFERIVPIIHQHGGTVVSFMGDGVMAVFGAPKPLLNPCEAAYQAARSMLADRHQLNADLVARGDRPLQMGIGLHAGEGVAGHIGAAARHEYTVIGDVTNVASRLEGLTKEVPFFLVCSRTVVDKLVVREGLVPLGMRAIRGHSPVEVFGSEPAGPDGETQAQNPPTVPIAGPLTQSTVGAR